MLPGLGCLHKEVPSRMASTSVKVRLPRARESEIRVPRPAVPTDPAGAVDQGARRRIASNFARLSAGRAGLPHDIGRGDVIAGRAAGRRGLRPHRVCVQRCFLAGPALARQQRRDCGPGDLAAPATDSSSGRPGPGLQVAVRPLVLLALSLVGSLTLADRSDWMILALYGSMLFTTAIGLDFVFRGTERMGLVAASLCIRTGIYAAGC